MLNCKKLFTNICKRINSIGMFFDNNGSASISNGTSFSIVSDSKITIGEGRYLLVASGTWAANTTGVRGVTFGNDNTWLVPGVAQMAISASGWTTRQSLSFYIETSGTTNVYLYAMQNSGGALSLTWSFQAVKIR